VEREDDSYKWKVGRENDSYEVGKGGRGRMILINGKWREWIILMKWEGG